jgi:hypothetical protein
MPQWAGKWKGGRFYIDDSGHRVFFIERRKRVVKLDTHDEQLAIAELTRFLIDPVGYEKPAAVVKRNDDPVYITKERIALYLESIAGTVSDHRKARASYLADWSKKGLDLRTVDARTLRAALGSFDGGYKGRAEALNAFARFLVRELRDLDVWRPLVNHRGPDPENARAERVAYSIDELVAAYKALTDQALKDLFHVRAATGMHHTEIAQIAGARVTSAPLPDKGVAIRTLGDEHEIRGVLQVVHRKKHRKERRHRQSVNAKTLDAVLRLQAGGVPDRMVAWKALEPIGIVPSNLRHTFVTLAGEVGELVTYTCAGVARSRIAQAIGHRQGSAMTEDRYDKLQVPPMVKIPLPFN